MQNRLQKRVYLKTNRSFNTEQKIDCTLCLIYYSAHVLARGLSPPPSADVIEITVLNDQLVISRPDPWIKR